MPFILPRWAHLASPAWKSDHVQVGILGPLEVRGDGGRPIDSPGARLRALLIRLALDAGRRSGLTA
jgi:hypothetical protein